VPNKVPGNAAGKALKQGRHLNQPATAHHRIHQSGQQGHTAQEQQLQLRDIFQATTSYFI
jgi:hypothetical protein